MKKGKLIVFEGVSGTGKETQAKLLQEFLKKNAIVCRIVYHPSPELKDILSQWRRKRNIDYVSETYFLLADRYNRVKEEILPALTRGEWVISLRNWVSALAYQAKTEKERSYLKKEFAWFEPKPDFFFYFDISPSVASERVLARHKKTGEPMGKFETPSLLAQIREKYHSVLATIPHHVIDALQPIASIHKQITSYINI